ncbi:MAG: (2Fe-2S)-binding protein [Deltaproteobacteria bacterium]|nr:(2Fe-2S)-binding protein [Deltaproteobacteria bacterium]
MIERRPLHFWVNGEEYRLEIPIYRLLIDVLRDDLHLTGTKRSCDIGVCGSCTVLMDGKSVSACLMLAARIDGRRLLTIEGLQKDGRLHPVQQAFLNNWGLQCGYCTPGMVLTAVELLEINPDPTPEDVREELMGNLCRCTGYKKIVESVIAAAKQLREVRSEK